jgi:hypothetical protein
MTTAVLNSVSSDKSGVASAVNGALREIGTAFGVALLGTLANRTYQAKFNGSSDIQALRATGGDALAPVIDLVGSGMNFGGRVISQMPEFATLPASVTKTLEQVSAEAFMSGMDRAIIFSTAGIIAAAVISYFLIDDAIVQQPIEEPAGAENESEGIRPGNVDFSPTAAD